MARVFVEARPKGRPEGSPIEDYVVEDHADHVLQTFKTQHEAIEWAKKTGPTPHVAPSGHKRCQAGCLRPKPPFGRRQDRGYSGPDGLPLWPFFQRVGCSLNSVRLIAC